MLQITEKRLDHILHNIKGKTIAVLGDLMLDRYIWGTVTRISPEAPVAVVDVESEQERLGGAANVARNIHSLGGIPMLIGVVGDDNSGRSLIKMITEYGFPTEGIVTDPSRPTTIKTRIIAHNQHVVRVDRELRTDIGPVIQRKILAVVQEHIHKIDGIIIEDYNKGVVIFDVIRKTIELSRSNGKIITVDPKFNNFFEYKNVSIFKPNQKEVEEALGIHLKTEEKVVEAGHELRKRLNAGGILLTRGEKGMSLFDSDGAVFHTPTRARNVADVSGAGDTVIATLTLALTAGATMHEAATVANYAGGIVCGYVGIVPIDPGELRAAIIAYEH